MQANPRTLDTLFNSQLRYVVPMFQRQYVWQEKPQWSTLWEDVVEKATLQLDGKSSNAHYLGAVIIEGVRPSSPREVKRFLVIDGQQRLTTLQLLFCAFRDVARARDWKTSDRAATRYLENVDPDVMENAEEELYKLWPTTLNRAAFCKVIRAGGRLEVERVRIASRNFVTRCLTRDVTGASRPLRFLPSGRKSCSLPPKVAEGPGGDGSPVTIALRRHSGSVPCCRRLAASQLRGATPASVAAS